MHIAIGLTMGMYLFAFDLAESLAVRADRVLSRPSSTIPRSFSEKQIRRDGPRFPKDNRRSPVPLNPFNCEELVSYIVIRFGTRAGRSRPEEIVASLAPENSKQAG
jgi:hypothetical protein